MNRRTRLLTVLLLLLSFSVAHSAPQAQQQPLQPVVCRVVNGVVVFDTAAGWVPFDGADVRCEWRVYLAVVQR